MISSMIFLYYLVIILESYYLGLSLVNLDEIISFSRILLLFIMEDV